MNSRSNEADIQANDGHLHRWKFSVFRKTNTVTRIFSSEGGEMLAGDCLGFDKPLLGDVRCMIIWYLLGFWIVSCLGWFFWAGGVGMLFLGSVIQVLSIFQVHYVSSHKIQCNDGRMSHKPRFYTEETSTTQIWMVGQSFDRIKGNHGLMKKRGHGESSLRKWPLLQVSKQKSNLRPINETDFRPWQIKTTIEADLDIFYTY